MGHHHHHHQDIEEGWPLGLRPLNPRVGGLLDLDLDLSASFNTLLLTASPTNSSVSSSDLDTLSTGSFFHDKSKSLGSLIGVSSILEMSRRSIRTTQSIGFSRDHRKVNMNLKPKPWLLSLCSKLTTDAVIASNTSRATNTPSLGHFLEAERRAVSRSTTTIAADYSPLNLNPMVSALDSNSLSVNGLVVAPRPHASASGVATSNGTKSNTHFPRDGNVFGARLLFPNLCGQLIK